MTETENQRIIESYRKRLAMRHKGFKCERIEMMTNPFLRKIAIDDLMTAPDNCVAIVLSKDGQLVGKDVLAVKGFNNGASYFMEYGSVIPL